MKWIKSTILYFIVICLLPASSLFGMNAPDTTLYLSFDRIDMPPTCLIPQKILKRPKVGLALSGGGIRGIAQIGVLQILEENEIPIDFIAGSSIGSIIGGLYASGYTPKQIWEIAKSIDWENILKDSAPRSTQFLGEKQERYRHIIQFRLSKFGVDIPQALTPGYRLTRILTELIMKAPYRSTDFDKLRVPLRIITTDLLTGEKIVLKSGSLAEAMRASIAIPLLFTPVKKENSLLVDGGILDNIPVEEVLTKADIIIAVDTTSPLRTQENLNAPWQIADQVTTIMQQNHNRVQAAKADISISLREYDYTSTDFERLEQLYQIGMEQTQKEMTKLKKMLNKKTLGAERSKAHYVTDIKLKGSKNTEVLNLISKYRNVRIKDDELKKIAESIYSIGNFKNVSISIKTKNDQSTVSFIVEENPVLSDVKISGNTLFPDTTLISCFKKMIGQSVNYYKGKECLRTIRLLYHTKGYSLMQIDSIDFDNHTKKLRIIINEGIVRKINFFGLHKTHDYVVRREFSLRPGDIFNSSLLQTCIDNIYGTDLFSSVTWSNERKNDFYYLNIKLQEKLFSVLRLGIRYDLERQIKTFIELSDKNVFGTGNIALVHAEYGTRDAKLEAQLRADRIFHTYLTSNVRLYSAKNKFYTYASGQNIGEYQKRINGFTVSLGQQIERFGTISFASRIEQILLTGIEGTGFDTGKLNIRTVSLSSVVDTRDYLPFPKHGKFHQFSYEVSSGKILTSSLSYFKVENRLESYYTFLTHHTIKPVLFWGTSDQTTPFSEQFKMGGLRSFLGLRDEEMVGRHFLIGSLEHRIQIDFQLPVETYISWRYDIGSMWRNNVDVKPKDFLHGIGCILSLDTILGPISLAYGRTSDHRSSIYFSAGFQF